LDKNGSVHSLWAFIKLSRPHFLVGGVLMFALGAAAAGRLDPLAYGLGQLLVTAAQVTAHFVNEYADVEPDRAIVRRTLFSGGSGVLVGGLLPPIVALRSAWVASALALGAAVAMAFINVPTALLGVAALAISWSYSMPPLRLLGSGFGELAASVVVAGIVPLMGAFSQGGTITGVLLWSIAIVLPLHVAMMLAFELPDLETDAMAGKRVLAVRIGRTGTRVLIVLLLVAGLAAVWGLEKSEPVRVWVAILFGLPSAMLILVAMLRDQAGLLTGSAVATLVLTAVGLLAGLLQ
jgi:1,4-dihydroxy-2-naphthoate octaprenyltransferase